MRWLLDHGANPTTETNNGITPISRAVASAPFNMVKLLLERGWPASIQHGRLLDSAIYRSCPDHLEVLDYLLRIGCQSDINKLEHKNRPDLRENTNWVVGCRNPLHHAVMEGRLDVVKVLVEGWGADPEVPDGKGRQAIDLARGSRHDDVAEYLLAITLHDRH